MEDTRPDPEVRVFGSPHRYYQGPDALNGLPRICAQSGSVPFLVVDADVLALLGDRLEKLFGDSSHHIAAVRGEVTAALMDDLAAQARAAGADLVVGIGGGKALDIGKGCAIRVGAGFISVPTVASNDSPTASGLAVYDEHHRMVAVESLGRNPEAVVVDTKLVASAPPQFLRAGIGDAIAKKFEGEASQAHGGLNAHYTRQLRTGTYIANGCYETIRKFGEAAMAAAGGGTPNEAFEAVVEANILMAGLGFENMGLSLAHGLTRGLVRTPVVDRAPHGYHVAYGTLVQLAAEHRPEAFIADLAEFYGRIGLPRSLNEMGLLNIEPETLRSIAENSAIAPKGAYLVVGYDAEALIEAMESTEERFRRTVRRAEHA